MDTTTQSPLIVASENAAKFAEWISTRGGLAVWQSDNLGNASASWITPALTAEGQPMGKPSWQANPTPRIIQDIAQVVVESVAVVKTIRLYHKRGDGLSYVLTDSCKNKVNKALAEVGKGATYRFNDNRVEICKPIAQVPLAEWLAQQTS